MDTKNTPLTPAAGTLDTSAKILKNDANMVDLLTSHFWCDFSDIIPSMTWDKTDCSH